MSCPFSDDTFRSARLNEVVVCEGDLIGPPEREHDDRTTIGAPRSQQHEGDANLCRDAHPSHEHDRSTAADETHPNDGETAPTICARDTGPGRPAPCMSPVRHATGIPTAVARSSTKAGATAGWYSAPKIKGSKRGVARAITAVMAQPMPHRALACQKAHVW